MSFLSFHYALLLLASVLAYRLATPGLRAAVLVAASGIFYASWNTSLCMLMFAAAVFAWQGSRDLQGKASQTRWAGGLVVALMAAAGLTLPAGDMAAQQTWRVALACVSLLWLLNLWLPRSTWSRKARFAAYLTGLLALLAVFKYFNFFVGSAQAMLGADPTARHGPLLQVLLPIGISFYVFQKISFLVDVWRGDEADSPGLIEFCAYATFFPQLVAGPIERVTQLLPQLRQPLPINLALGVEAVALLLIGYFKKVFVADNCAILANYAFDHPAAVGPAWLLMGALAFTVQIYGDFSGYTDIARGSALLMGVRLSRNFAMPYLATSVVDFWHRWHITLSTWLRDYLYKPLGGSRRSTALKYRNLMIVMVLGGLWHGASWNFVLWGLYWGTLLLVNHAWRDRFGAPRPTDSAGLRAWLGWAATTLAMLVGWVLFRATDLTVLPKFLQLTQPLFSAEWRGALAWLSFHALPLAMLHLLAWRERDEAAGILARPMLGAVALALALWLTLGSDAAQRTFIYFQF